MFFREIKSNNSLGLKEVLEKEIKKKLLCFPGFEPGPMRSRRKPATICTTEQITAVQLVASLRRDVMGPGSNPGKHNHVF